MTRKEGNVVPFVRGRKGVSDMSADEILEHLKGRFSDNIVVLGFHENGTLELDTNASYERANWMLDRAKAMLFDDNEIS